MKNKFISVFEKLMLRKRAIIETIYDQLKNISQIEPTQHRSVWNFYTNVVAGLIAYTCQEKVGDYVEYDAESDSYFLTNEQAFVLTDENSAAYLPGAFILATAPLQATPKITERFKSGKGLGWHEHDEELFRGTELFFRPGYGVHLVNEWIPSLDGVAEKLKSGAKVADVGCGHGASTLLMAQAYPNSEFYGFDYHDKSIETARRKAEEAGVSDRVKFEVAKSKEYPGEDYDFVTFELI